MMLPREIEFVRDESHAVHGEGVLRCRCLMLCVAMLAGVDPRHLECPPGKEWLEWMRDVINELAPWMEYPKRILLPERSLDIPDVGRGIAWYWNPKLHGGLYPDGSPMSAHPFAFADGMMFDPSEEKPYPLDAVRRSLQGQIGGIIAVFQQPQIGEGRIQ